MINRRSILASGVGALAASSVSTVQAQTVENNAVSGKPAEDRTRQLQRAIDKASQESGQLFIPAGTHHIRTLKITKPVTLIGSRGQTEFIVHGSGPGIEIENTASVSLVRLTIKSVHAQDALVSAQNAHQLIIENCMIAESDASGIQLNGCSGKLLNNTVSGHRRAGIFAINSRGLEIAGNHVHDIGDNGILVWQSEKRADGTLVVHNRIERIDARSGGNGQNGNGVNVYRAGNVTVAQNQISLCRFSAIRNNSGSNCQILGNSCTRCDEVAIFVEFAYEGAVVSDNLIESAAMGISITNADHGGRLAVCANNLVRDLFGARSNPDSVGVGIFAENDTAMTGNVIEGAKRAGIVLGWGPFCRNLLASNNIVRLSGKGILASVAEGAGSVMINGNIIADVEEGAIFGMDHRDPRTGDLADAGETVPANLQLENNIVT